MIIKTPRGINHKSTIGCLNKSNNPVTEEVNQNKTPTAINNPPKEAFTGSPENMNASFCIDKAIKIKPDGSKTMPDKNEIKDTLTVIIFLPALFCIYYLPLICLRIYCRTSTHNKPKSTV